VHSYTNRLAQTDCEIANSKENVSELEFPDLLQTQIRSLEVRILQRVELTCTTLLPMSLPGRAQILSIVIDLVQL